VEWDNVSHAFGGLSRQLISITLSPRMLGSVSFRPRGSYTVWFCSATNFDTFLRHCNRMRQLARRAAQDEVAVKGCDGVWQKERPMDVK
jgi:hypothetical protein